jgi:hypothetical protein
MTLDHSVVPHGERQVLSGNNYEEISDACMSNETRVRKFDDGALAQKIRAELYSQFLAEYGIVLSYQLSADCTASA